MGRVLRVFVSLLVLSSPPRAASAQEPGTEPAATPGDLELQQNYPNPFETTTTFPFVLHEGLFAGTGPAVVSIRVFNLLGEEVASPVALDHAAGRDVRVVGLAYTEPGAYEAFWDGNDRAGSAAPAGLYIVELSVDDQRAIRRIYRARNGGPAGGAG